MAGGAFSGAGEFCGGAGTIGEIPAGGSGVAAKGDGGGTEIKGAGVTGTTG
jgi:hypothetical protein